jgi:hypothetical protein
MELKLETNGFQTQNNSFKKLGKAIPKFKVD